MSTARASTVEVSVVGWPVALFPVCVTLKSSGLDLFERLVLELTAAGVADPERLAALTGLEPDFARAVRDELRKRGALDDQGALTQVGRRALDDQVEHTVSGWMARDALTDTPLPIYLPRRPARRDDLKPLDARRADSRSPTEDHARSAFVDALLEWRRFARDRHLPLPDALRAGTPSGLSFLAEGEDWLLPVTLTTDDAGRPRLEATDLPVELLEDRIERLEPTAWKELTVRAREAQAALEALRRAEATRDAADRLVAAVFGDALPDDLAPPLRNAALARVLAEGHPSQHKAALTEYRGFTEAVAKRLGHHALTAEADTQAQVLPKAGGKAARSLAPRLEALAHPDALHLPDPEELAALVGQLRKARRRPDTQGFQLTAWPFWLAALDPQAPRAADLRAAAARCPSLWRELDALRRRCNAGAHHADGPLATPDYATLDEAVRRILGALGGAPPAEVPAPVFEGIPAEVSDLLRQAAAAATRGELDVDSRRTAVEALWKAAASWADAGPRDLDEVSLTAWADDLPIDALRTRDVLARKLDGLKPPDDDGVGYELPEWVANALPESVESVRRGQWGAARQRVIAPLLAAAAGDSAARRWVATAVADRDPWDPLCPLAETHDATVRSAALAASEWHHRFEAARAAVVELFSATQAR